MLFIVLSDVIMPAEVPVLASCEPFAVFRSTLEMFVLLVGATCCINTTISVANNDYTGKDAFKAV